MTDQIPLFDFEPPAPDDPSVAALDAAHAEARVIAADLPDTLRFGTSSWSFPGWKGFVYAGAVTPATLARDGLRQYASHPLLRTVGIDRSYYAPIPIADLRRYAEQLPADFRGCAKAPSSVTSATLGPPGSDVPNPHFLSVDQFVAEQLEPFALAFRQHAGPFVIEFPSFARNTRIEPAAFLARLDRFLEQLPTDFQYAVELRDQRLLTPLYGTILKRHGVGHVYNYWSAMPGLAAQARVIPPEEQPFTVVRLLLKPGTWYEEQRERFRPFTAIVERDALMRHDVVELVERVLRVRRQAWILVNNKAEGSSPLSIVEIARRMAERRRQLFVAQRRERIDTSGAAGGDPAGGQRDGAERERNQDEREGIER